MDPDDVVPVYIPVDQIEAAAIRQALKNEGIWSHLEGEQQSSWVGGGFWGNAGRWRMRLLVRAADAVRVKEIIETGSWPTAG
jgi:hypothetical protein